MQYDQNNGRIEGCSSFQMTGYVVGADYQTSEWKLIGKRTETACPVDRNIRGMDTSGILTAICTRPARDRYNARTHLLQSSIPCCGGVGYSLTKKKGASPLASCRNGFRPYHVARGTPYSYAAWREPASQCAESAETKQPSGSSSVLSSCMSTSLCFWQTCRRCEASRRRPLQRLHPWRVKYLGSLGSTSLAVETRTPSLCCQSQLLRSKCHRLGGRQSCTSGVQPVGSSRRTVSLRWDTTSDLRTIVIEAKTPVWNAADHSCST